MATSPDALGLAHRGRLAAAPCHQETFQLPAVGASVAEARRRVVALLHTWGVDREARDSAELVVSELFTNAVRHTDSARVECALRADAGRVRLEVTDQGSATTQLRPGPGDPDGEGGRGLLLVDALSEEWGVRPGDDGRGPVVWAELRYESASGEGY